MNAPEMGGSFTVKTRELRKLLWDCGSTADSVLLYFPSTVQIVYAERGSGGAGELR